MALVVAAFPAFAQRNGAAGERDNRAHSEDRIENVAVAEIAPRPGQGLFVLRLTGQHFRIILIGDAARNRPDYRKGERMRVGGTLSRTNRICAGAAQRVGLVGCDCDGEQRGDNNHFDRQGNDRNGVDRIGNNRDSGGLGSKGHPWRASYSAAP